MAVVLFCVYFCAPVDYTILASQTEHMTHLNLQYLLDYLIIFFNTFCAQSYSMHTSLDLDSTIANLIYGHYYTLTIIVCFFQFEMRQCIV